MLCVRLTLGHCSTHVIKLSCFTFEKCRGVKVSTANVTSISYFTHTERPFIPTIIRGVLAASVHSLIFRYVRDRSVRDLPLMQGWLRPRSLNFFSQLSKQCLILSISVQMLCEWSGMNEIVDRMSIVYFRSDCGFHNYPYMVRGRTFMNSFSATIWRKWGQLSPKTLVFNIYYIY